MTDDQVLFVLQEAVRKYGDPMSKEGYLYIERKLGPEDDVDLNRVLRIWNTHIADGQNQLNDFSIRGNMALFGMDPNQ